MLPIGPMKLKESVTTTVVIIIVFQKIIFLAYVSTGASRLVVEERAPTRQIEEEEAKVQRVFVGQSR